MMSTAGEPIRGPLAGVALLLAAVLALAPGCDDTRLYKVTTHYDLFFPEGSDQTDTFVQKAAARIDILWVVDNSPSMLQEQNDLAANFDSFIQFIDESDVDYQIGVISTDLDLAGHQGQLQGNPTIITRDTQPDPASAFSQNIRVGTGGAGNERGLEAAYHALSEPLISGANAGFLRSDAALAIIFVSDEDDHSFGQIGFYQRTFEQLKRVGNENRVMAGAVVGPQPDGCATAAAGTRYHMLVQAVGGSIGSICEADFSDTLSQLGLTVAGLDRRFQLSDENPEQESIEVRVAGQPIEQDWQNGWTFENGNIFFNGSYVPPPGSTIEVSYLHPQREFPLSQTPAYDPENPGASIEVTVYGPDAPECASSSDCAAGGCGLAGKCDGVLIANDLASGWVLETRTAGGAEQHLVAFERDYWPAGGSTVQVVYDCAGGCTTP